MLQKVIEGFAEITIWWISFILSIRKNFKSISVQSHRSYHKSITVILAKSLTVFNSRETLAYTRKSFLNEKNY